MTRHIILCALLITSLAQAGMSRPKELTLDQVVEQSSLIVLVVQDTPSFAPRAVDFGANGKKYPYNVLRFRVLETLKGSPEPADSKKIDVVDSDLGTLLNLTKSGMSKTFFSPYFAAGKGLLESRDTLILFLRRQNDRGENPFVALDACLPSTQKKSIQELISLHP